jgi:exoribonuclease R
MSYFVYFVSHFVTPDTALDEEAQARATTTYMVQRAYHMLPRMLCEQLCSLTAAEDRYAFSVVWELTPEGKRVSEW